MTESATPKQIAAWMHQEFERQGCLNQYSAARGIMTKFGQQHLYKNANGNWAINKSILAEFRKLTAETALWSRSDQRWVKRREHHPTGKRMID